MPRPGHFTPGKTRCSLYRRLGEPQGRAWRAWKISPPPGFDPRTIQSIASLFTDWSITAHTIYLSFRSCDSCRHLPEPKHHSFLFSHWSSSKCLVLVAACTPSIHIFLGRPLFLLSPGIHSIINFGSLSSCILLTWPYHWSLFLSIMSIMSGFSFIPIISFICSFFILSIG